MFFIKDSTDITKAEEENTYKFSYLTKVYAYFCNHKHFLNSKIILFFFHIVYLASKDSEFQNFKLLKKFKFIGSYKILFTFLKFVRFILYFTNNSFKMNSQKFFSEKKKIIEFLIYYKFFLFMIFLNKKNKYSDLIKFYFNIYFKYLLYSVFYFLNLYIINLNNLKSKKKFKSVRFYKIPAKLDLINSNRFYKSHIYKMKLNNSIKIFKEDLPLHLFCCNRTNFKSFDDSNFSIFLNNIRYLYRVCNVKKNSFIVLNDLIKRAIPLSKIIYQRRGRNLIPLMTFIYSPDIRNSLGFKYILNESSKIKGLSVNSYENKILINLLDILISNKQDDFIYQSDKDSDIRKEAYNRGYYLKTLKARFKKI